MREQIPESNNRVFAILRIVSLFFILPILSLQSQEILWPTDASQLMTSSFGEYRAGHFHAGIDVKTWGKVGYKVYAVSSGSIVRVSVSPYGYGQALYIRLNSGMTVVYGHLSRFTEPVATIIKNEQKRKGRYAVQKYFKTGVLQVKQGEVVGYTGASGNGVPHLHFEVRDTLNRPFNPLFLGYSIRDTRPPVIRAVAVTPLDGASHAEGDWLPHVVSVQKQDDGSAAAGEPITVAGRIGLAVSVTDQADGAHNRFAPYRVRLFLDGRHVFTSRYDRFTYGESDLVELDRDYRLNRMGRGLFQKLYRDVGNSLTLYEPTDTDAGLLLCVADDMMEPFSENSTPQVDGGALLLPPGDHAFRIEAADFFGNVSEVTGVLRVQSEASYWAECGTVPISETDGGSPDDFDPPDLKVTQHLLGDAVRFSVASDQPWRSVPILTVETGPWNRRLVTLRPKPDGSWFGLLPWTIEESATLISTVRTAFDGLSSEAGDTTEIFRITPQNGGRAVSQDGCCMLSFSHRSVYRPLLVTCREEPLKHGAAAGSAAYRFDPGDELLKGRVTLDLSVNPEHVDNPQTGVYRLRDDGKAGYVGSTWEEGRLTVPISGLGRFAALCDTVPPEILFVHPKSDQIISDPAPEIAVGFRDTLSGISGEENYRIMLDGVSLIVEYQHWKDTGIHQIENPLPPGDHVIEAEIRDRAGNVATVRSRFTVRSDSP